MLRILFAVLGLPAIAGCASLPESAYVTTGGCAVAQWKKAWVEANVASMTWDGGCKNGLASGHGTHTVALNNGKTKRYVGEMSGGFMTGKGEYTQPDGWRLNGHFFEANLIAGEIYGADGRLVFKGSMVDKGKCNGKEVSYGDQRYKEGNLHLRDGSYIEGGRYDPCVGMYAGSADVNARTGAGIVYGKHVKDGQVVSRFVEGKSFKDDASYTRAKQAFLERAAATFAPATGTSNAATGQNSAAAQSAAERIGKQYDQRIAEAREGCTSSKDSCDTKCATLAAVALLTRKGKAEEVNQCASDCETEKTRCDQKVSALVQEKTRAVAAAVAPPAQRTVASTTTSSASTTGPSAAGASVAPNASVAEAVAAMKDYPRAGKGMCEAALDKWRDLVMPTSDQDYERYGWMKYPGTNSVVETLKAEYDLQYMKRCAKSQAEYDERTEYIRRTHERHKESLATHCRQFPGPSCQKPAGFDEWFARYTRNGDISLEWARTAKAPPPPTKEEEACRVEIWRWEMLKKDRESKLPKDSVVRLSEINMWFMERSMDTIKRLCPGSERYRKDYEVAKAALPQVARVCSQMASAPPCLARLDPDKPAFKPSTASAPKPTTASAPAPASAPKPTPSAPASGQPIDCTKLAVDSTGDVIPQCKPYVCPKYPTARGC